MADVPHLRAATPSDIPALAEACISAANFSIPGRKLGEELYDLEKDISVGEPGVSPPGKLRKQFEEQLANDHIWLAEVRGRVVGSIVWYSPRRNEELGYKPGEVSGQVVVLIPTISQTYRSPRCSFTQRFIVAGSEPSS